SGAEVLDHISCPSLRFCLAESQDAVEAWNGTTWKVLPGTGIGGNTGLWCTSPRFCMDVGDQSSRWNGRTWTPVPLSRFALFDAFMCASRGDRVAIGISNHPQSPGKSRAGGWNGPAGRVLPVPPAFIQAISCASATFCLAKMRTSPGPPMVQSW